MANGEQLESSSSTSFNIGPQIGPFEFGYTKDMGQTSTTANQFSQASTITSQEDKTIKSPSPLPSIALSPSRSAPCPK